MGGAVRTLRREVTHGPERSQDTSIATTDDTTTIPQQQLISVTSRMETQINAVVELMRPVYYSTTRLTVPETITLVSSWSVAIVRCSELSSLVSGVDHIAKTFSDRLYDIHPESRSLFVDALVPGRMIFQLVNDAIARYGNESELRYQLTRTSQSYLAMGVSSQLYASMGDVLIWSLNAILGSDFSDELRCIWLQLFSMIWGIIMKNALMLEMGQSTDIACTEVKASKITADQYYSSSSVLRKKLNQSSEISRMTSTVKRKPNLTIECAGIPDYFQPVLIVSG